MAIFHTAQACGCRRHARFGPSLRFAIEGNMETGPVLYLTLILLVIVAIFYLFQNRR